MNFKTASKFDEVFEITEDYTIKFGTAVLEDPMAKGYVYANLYFFDEVQKEV